ncbi:2-dehydropantoate 2-reductase [Rhizobiales bacterium]|uniref:ketopantoate reductase family protein n=1 Tax=Hongsoonwoonella zoysiae TaxID=2821844 RepID=UPI0015615E7E|nr:2-dehydropantoate 2-reductase [Hongsoonwoonella zoysiae]NRG17224.1 2-dehydropantoate 2-reductase [Hongsoonwoonella zoysiae]
MNARAGNTIVVWGAGAIGGIIGAYMARAGVDVLLVDADKRHVAAINECGLSITGVDDFTVKIDAVTPDNLAGTFETVLLAVKAHHTGSAAASAARFLSGDGYILSLQNGLNDDAIAAHAGGGRVALSLVNFASDVTAPGVIHYGGRGSLVVGEVDGRKSERLARLCDSLKAFDETVHVTDNVKGYLWGKIGYGGILIATALTNERMADLLADRRWRPHLASVARDIVTIARAAGIEPVGVDGFDAEAFLTGDAAGIDATFEGMAEHYRHSAKERSGVWRDLAVNRRKTEVGPLMEPVISAGRKAGLPVENLKTLVAMIGEIELGTRDFGLKNLERLLPLNY